MGNFYTDVIQKDPRYNSTKRIADPNLLEPVTRKAVMSILADALVDGLHLMIFETYRSQNRQEALFNQGVTQLQKVGTHHYGIACDIVKVVNREPNWDGDFSFLKALAKKYGLISGLDWGEPDTHHSFIDPDHVQRIAVADQGRLFNGSWYPDSNYVP